MDDAIRFVDSDKSKKNRRRIGVDHTEEPDAINLDVFVEILNILDEELLNDNSFHELRRTWTPDEPIDQVIAVRHLVMWCCLFNRMELIDSIFERKVLKQSPEMTRKIVEKLNSANRFKNSILQQSLNQTSPLVTFTMVSQMRRYQVMLD